MVDIEPKYEIGSIVYYLSEDKLIHKSKIWRREANVLDDGNKVTIVEIYRVEGKTSPLGVNSLFSSVDEAVESISKKMKQLIVDDIKV